MEGAPCRTRRGGTKGADDVIGASLSAVESAARGVAVGGGRAQNLARIKGEGELNLGEEVREKRGTLCFLL